ncbi:MULTISPECIES: ribosome biogenesis GTPase YlqF [Parvimonas]|uniref:ribosome biogenesis GTPase YlqF n=1 Tax=Parvimonas TaxID=543311 RepID=UPI0020057AA9|nr:MULTISPECIES: ribosome biogenesis GTPase YlqF [Parvimonas]MCK6130769.1 ribosome biogenesis GTPase YlqF [Parvimonas micra]MCK6136414.1 ribosome biogenesis GTPase YlqF [Parvimonas micra]MCK6137885.1 ribosome biogenesis GTPase YlqF [Parvimonas micra]MCK6154413.1 ribosome biogenesis GTPase YlqF [Parvimonas micra]MEB3058414.1 ribosome biogenesis GTPase YlqF [Parvimonas sp. D9]
MNINWYPGHMKKTMDNIRSSLKLVDIVGEIIDSRIPISSKNPVIDDVLKDKPRIMILNKSDMADENETKKWLSYYRKKGYGAVVVDALHSKGLDKIYSVAKEMLADKFKKLEEKNLSAKTIRMMIVGIPNVGKSTFINSISKRKSAKIGDRPGVTKQVQWIKTKNDLELLDTPGVLWPKFEDERIGLHLAFTGAIKDEIMDIENLAFRFIDELNKRDVNILKNRYNLSEDSYEDTLYLMDEIGRNRGAILKKNEIDYFKVANLVFDDFRKVKLGRITLETVEDIEKFEEDNGN